MSAIPPLDAQQIREEMVRVRSELHDDVGEVVASAKALTDWRQYVRSYPWICLSAAAVAAYVIVPARSKPKPAKSEPLSGSKKATKEAAVESGVKAGATAGILGSLVSMAGTMALRGAMNFASRKATDFINSKIDGPSRGGAPAKQSFDAPKPYMSSAPHLQDDI
jgi:hypothetical protein